MSGSVSFDRAADYYDQTRVLPDEVEEQVIGMLAAELEGKRVLEIGVGTGRIGVPLAKRGIDLFGLDIAPRMLAKLREKLGNERLPAVAADVTIPPFREGSFDTVLAAHVFHLIPAWRQAVARVLDLLRPPGTLLVDLGAGFTGGERDLIRDRFASEAGVSRVFRGTADIGEFDSVMRQAGAELRVLPEIAWTQVSTHNDSIRRLESNQYSLTWDLSDEERIRAGEATRAWAIEEFGDIDAPKEDQLKVMWRAYDLHRAS